MVEEQARKRDEEGRRAVSGIVYFSHKLPKMASVERLYTLYNAIDDAKDKAGEVSVGIQGVNKEIWSM